MGDPSYILLQRHGTFPYCSCDRSNDRGNITLEDIRNGLALGARLSQLETAAHISFILEATVSPILDKTDRVILKLKHGATENERFFIQAITSTLNLKASGRSFPTIDRFKRDCALYLCPKQALKGKGNGDFNDQPSPLRSHSNIIVDDPKSILQAEARNYGADFLFPQNTHDKILACILVALMLAPSRTLVTQSLIDLVMSVKSTGKVTDLEDVSEESIQGVITLLRLCGVTEDLYDPQALSYDCINDVTVILKSDIDSFETLRARHDAFVLSFINDLELNMTSSLQGEILWTVLGPKKILRLTAISSFSKQVAAFYEKRGFLSAASQSKEPSFLGFESTNETRSLTIANEESEARRSTSKTIHPQLLRKNYELDQGKLNQSYVKIDSADDNLHPMMGMLQADTDTFTGIAPADRGRIERDSTKIKIDQIDIVEEDLGLNFKSDADLKSKATATEENPLSCLSGNSKVVRPESGPFQGSLSSSGNTFPSPIGPTGYTMWYSPQQHQHLLGEGDEEDAVADLRTRNIINDINSTTINNVDNTEINKYSNKGIATNPLPSLPEYNFSLHMESCTAGVITRSTLNRIPLPADAADAVSVVDIGDSIDCSQTMSFESHLQKEYKMEDFPVFPSHHTSSTYQHQQQGWPVRYQSSNMPTSGFFHVTPPPPHVAFDEAALELDARHHLNIDGEMPVTGSTADTTDSFNSSNSINSPNSTDSRGVSSMNTTLPSESVSSSAFPTPMKTAESSLSSKKTSKHLNDKEGSSESIFLSTGASTPLGSLSSEKGGSGSESGSGSGSGSGSRSEADSTLKSHGVLRHTVE